MSTYSHTFFDEFQLAAADGYTVIAGNPRGSDGYGEQWAASIVGDLGNRDWADVTALTDHLAALPEVDDSRIGIGGGSYGGFMTSWAIGHTQRYRAALVERAVTNWETMAGTSDIGSYFLPMLLDASPETDVERLRHQSPISYATSVTTPTLILHSEEDWRCPIEQAEQLFAAYRRAGVDVTFARFPGENHELSRSGSPRHRVERFGFVHDFFARHLHPDGRPSRI
jgi:dipeptidyl aminopeptidase/acylaminoacyl peptidase